MNIDKKKAQKIALSLKNFINSSNIENNKFVSVKLEDASSVEEIQLFESFKEKNEEVYSLMRDIVATVSYEEPAEIGLLELGKGFFLAYGSECIYFTMQDLVLMLINHQLFKKAYRIHSSFLSANGFNCLIMK